MNNYERYYRRAYNALQKLIKAYKDGYDSKKMSELRESLRLEAIAHEQVTRAHMSSEEESKFAPIKDIQVEIPQFLRRNR